VKLYCATGNRGKLREFQEAAERLAPSGISIEPLPGLAGISPCAETGATFEENAIQKAVYYSAYAPGMLFADDSGLEVDVLGGAPGVRSARFAGPQATDESNNRLLLEKLRGVKDRTARFVCVIVLAEKGRTLGTFRGVAEGVIVDTASGANGFGYDPYFFYSPLRCTFAELDSEQKLEVSHRGNALREMLKFLAARRSPRYSPI
jgi:XTP/dITP diphosphohydrolase